MKKIVLISTLTLSTIFFTSQAFAFDVFICDNSGNVNDSWSTVPGDQSGLDNAFNACAGQGGMPYIRHFNPDPPAM